MSPEELKEWKYKALDIAVREMLESEMKLDLDRLFKRARMVFEHGYKEKFQDWETFWKQEEVVVPITKPVVKKELKKVVAPPQQTDKVACPKCGDMIPTKWKQHLVGSKGKCGWGVPEKNKGEGEIK